MRIAFIGSRGIPARYSGFETFYEQIATRLVDRGHDVTVYNRSHFIKDVKGEFGGVRLISLPCVQTKHLETITHTALSTLHAVTQRYDIVYYCIVGNAPLTWIPRVFGSKTLLNVDGEDWAREKWSGFARWYQRWCEKIATRAPTVVISDALAIQRRYRETYGAETVFAPYGANVQSDPRLDMLNKLNLSPDQYILFVGRFVPENSIHTLIKAFEGVHTSKKLVLIGDAPYMDHYKEQLKALSNDRVIFTGYVFGADYAQLSTHAYLYVMPSGIDGTRPAVLDQLGFGNCVLVRDSKVNLEVIADCGPTFDGQQEVTDLRDVLQRLIDDPEEVDAYRNKAAERITTYYNWQRVTDFYETLFNDMLERASLQSFE